MPILDRLQFSLRDLMVFVVVVGIYVAGVLSEYQRFGASFLIIFVGPGCVYLAVAFYYRDLSPWLWLVIATILMRPVAQLVGNHHFTRSFTVGESTPPLYFVITTTEMLLPLFGTIMVYRDVRRQLGGYQEEVRLLSAALESATSTAEPSSSSEQVSSPAPGAEPLPVTVLDPA